MKNIVATAVLTIVAVLLSHLCERAHAQQPPPVDLETIASHLSNKDLETRRQAAQIATQQPDFRLLDVLLSALSDTDPVVRQRAAQAIRLIPDERVDQTAIQLLGNPDVIVRREMVRRFEGRGTPQAAAVLAGSINDGDHEVRQQAARILCENAHQDATPILRRAIEHQDARVRYYATARLERDSAGEALPLLIARLGDSDQEVRQRAIQALRQLPDGVGDKAVVAALKHQDHAIRCSAAEHFNNPAHQQRTPEAVDVLASALSDSHNSVRQRAAAALRASKEERATSILLATLKHSDPDVRRHAVARLHEMPNPQLIDPLIAACDDLDFPVRSTAVAALNRLEDPRAKAAAAAAMGRDSNVDRNKLLADAKTPGQLRELCSHRDNDVRRMAAEALRRLEGNEAAQMAISALENPDPEVRRHMVERMREKPDAAAVQHLRKALGDSDENTRQLAVNALRSIPGDEAIQASLAAFQHQDALVRQRVVDRFRDQPDARAVPLLVHALDDWDQHVRREAAQALRRRDDAQALQASLAAFEHFDVEVRNHAIYRFAERPDAVAIPALMKVLNQGDSRNWNGAAYAVRRINDESAVQAAFLLFNHSDAEVRNHAVARFQELPEGRVTALLARALEDRDMNVRRQAAVSLRRTPGEEAKQATLAAFNHPDEQVRLHAVYRFIEFPDPSVTLKLIEMLDDENEGVRRHAVSAIGQSATADTPAPLVPLLYHGDAELRRIIATKLKPIVADRQRVVESPLSTERTIERMKSQPPITTDTPTPLIEMIGGDRIAAEVVGGDPAAASADGRTGILLIKLLQLKAQSAVPSLEATTDHARIHPRWIRRIVWKSQGFKRYSPGVVFLHRGGRVEYGSVQWFVDGIVVLCSDGIKRIPFREIAELHLPDRDPWAAYCEQLAALGCKSTDRILRLDCSDGSRITVCADRFAPYFDVESVEPNEWKHGARPAWSLDRLVTPHRWFGLRSWLPATEAPLAVPRGDREVSAEIWPWKADRNVRGECLKSGARQYGWGFGAHADNVLRFPLPRFAAGFQTELGLDRVVGDRGCARGIVRLRVRDDLSELYRSPLMIGSKTVQDTGVLKFPLLDDATQLELFADSAGDERPANADPLNICDFVDWLEPRLLLDEARLSAAISDAARQLEQIRFDETAISTGARLLPQ